MENTNFFSWTIPDFFSSSFLVVPSSIHLSSAKLFSSSLHWQYFPANQCNLGWPKANKEEFECTKTLPSGQTRLVGFRHGSKVRILPITFLGHSSQPRTNAAEPPCRVRRKVWTQTHNCCSSRRYWNPEVTVIQVHVRKMVLVHRNKDQGKE